MNHGADRPLQSSQGSSHASTDLFAD